ncbi:hypothetical protein CC86DRAFT_412121 [Ophiobolus disseminans]|uniref:Uncharacterized protein n=1 Tax=Ophiobolus disseminans TaxID=1469910 RepID=A0A6A6ZGT5_9PLEO|nr:hypothetical protein CC86DRAFT_412121 [Ophiobolus disseminans]
MDWRDSEFWNFGHDAVLRIFIEFKCDVSSQLDDVRMCIVPFAVASAATWSHHVVTFAIVDPDTQSQLTIPLGLLRRRVLSALKRHMKKYPNDSKSEPCPEVWVNGRCQVKEVIRAELKMLEASEVEANNASIMDVEEEDKIPPSTSHDDGRLHSTIRYLEWATRHWRKVW